MLKDINSVKQQKIISILQVIPCKPDLWNSCSKYGSIISVAR